MTEKAVAIGISVNAQISKDKQIALQTAIERDCKPEELDAILDKLVKSLERKTVQYDIEALEADIADHEKHLRQMLEDIERVDEKQKEAYASHPRRGEYKPSAKEIADKANIEISKKRFVDEIAVRKLKVEKLKAKF